MTHLGLDAILTCVKILVLHESKLNCEFCRTEMENFEI